MSNVVIGSGTLLSGIISESVCRLFDLGKGEPKRKGILGKRYTCFDNWNCIFSFCKFIQIAFVNQSVKTR